MSKYIRSMYILMLSKRLFEHPPFDMDVLEMINMGMKIKYIKDI